MADAAARAAARYAKESPVSVALLGGGTLGFTKTFGSSVNMKVANQQKEPCDKGELTEFLQPQIPCRRMVPVAGIEPATFGLQNRCSTS